MTPNKDRGEVAVKLKTIGDVILRPTFEAACKIENETGLSITALAGKLASREALGIQVVTAIVFHGAHAAGDTRTREQFGASIVKTGLGNITAPVLDFIAAYLVGDTEAGESEAPADK